MSSDLIFKSSFEANDLEVWGFVITSDGSKFLEANLNINKLHNNISDRFQKVTNGITRRYWAYNSRDSIWLKYQTP